MFLYAYDNDVVAVDDMYVVVGHSLVYCSAFSCP